MTDDDAIENAKLMWQHTMNQARAITERLTAVSDSLDDLYGQMPSEQIEQLKNQISVKQQEMQKLIADSEQKYLEKLRKLDPRL